VDLVNAPNIGAKSAFVPSSVPPSVGTSITCRGSTGLSIPAAFPDAKYKDAVTSVHNRIKVVESLVDIVFISLVSITVYLT
jgi:hypothetical protein